jgi:di/tricarboxylate transporter
VFLLAGSLALGVALEKAGLTTALANVLARGHEVASPFVVMAGFFIAAVIISEFM